MAIDRKKIIQEMSKVSVVGNEEGMIPGFNVYVQQLPADFWNGFARRIVNYVPEDLVESAEALLVNAARECGYHTGYGIITSDEWNEVVKPMIEKEPEDILHGAYAVFTAWGWPNPRSWRLFQKKKWSFGPMTTMKAISWCTAMLPGPVPI